VQVTEACFSLTLRRNRRGKKEMGVGDCVYLAGLHDSDDARLCQQTTVLVDACLSDLTLLNRLLGNRLGDFDFCHFGREIHVDSERVFGNHLVGGVRSVCEQEGATVRGHR
jgi:hypothetical protein